MSHKVNNTIAVIGIDIGKNSFHVVVHDERGAIVSRDFHFNVVRKLTSRGLLSVGAGSLGTAFENLSPRIFGNMAVFWRIEPETG